MRYKGGMDDGKLVRLLKALADGSRFRMVQEIAAAGELTCGEVGELFDLAQPTVSHHLKILADSGVLFVRRDGQHALISVNGALLDEALMLVPRRLRTKPRPVVAAASVSRRPLRKQRARRA